MTHGHELRWAGCGAGGRGSAGQRGIKEGKWDNFNSIINKIYLKRKEKVYISIKLYWILWYVKYASIKL